MVFPASTNTFQNVHQTNHPFSYSLPKPTSIYPISFSFQSHASSTTFPTVSTTIDLPNSPIFSFNRVYSSSLVQSLYNRGQRFQCTREQIEDNNPSTTNDYEWENPSKQPSITSNDDQVNYPNSRVENPQNGESNSPPSNVGDANSVKNGIVSTTYVDEWWEKIDTDVF